MTSAPTSCIRWFNDLRLTDLPLVGGKNASLGEMARADAAGRAHPEGFAVTAEGLPRRARRIRRLGRAAPRARRPGQARREGAGACRTRCREIVYGAPMPKHVETTIREAWRARWWRATAKTLSVAVRSSATAEDLPTPASPPARHLPQHPGRGGSARRGEALPGLAVHRPRHLLPHRQGLRPLQGLPLGGGDADGAQRSRLQRRDVHDRHRIGPTPTWCSSPAPGAGRERGAGRGRPRRVLRSQADLPTGLPQRAEPHAGRQAGADGLRQRPRASRW